MLIYVRFALVVLSAMTWQRVAYFPIEAMHMLTLSTEAALVCVCIVGVDVLVNLPRLTAGVFVAFVGAAGWLYHDRRGALTVGGDDTAAAAAWYQLGSALVAVGGLALRVAEMVADGSSSAAAERKRLEGVAYLVFLRLALQYVVAAHWLEGARSDYGAHLDALRRGTVQPRSSWTRWVLRAAAVQEWILLAAALVILGGGATQ